MDDAWDVTLHNELTSTQSNTMQNAPPRRIKIMRGLGFPLLSPCSHTLYVLHHVTTMTIRSVSTVHVKIVVSTETSNVSQKHASTEHIVSNPHGYD